MSSRLDIARGDLPAEFTLETYDDRTVWIVYSEGRHRVTLREYAEHRHGPEHGPFLCSYHFPLPGWMGEDQDDPCQCDAAAEPGQRWCAGEHQCSHTRAKAVRS